MDRTEIEIEKTQIEDATHIEEVTEIEKPLVETTVTDKRDLHSIKFQDFKTIKQFPTSGAEADIYLLEKEGEQFVLKLYRFNMKPSRDMIDKLKDLGRKYPEDIIEIYDIGFDEALHRWYELQEYAKFGSLKDLMNDENGLLQNNINTVIRETALLLTTLHSENIIHRDIKPDNLLVRTMEPLDLIITDFGISSVLDEELSKKMTTKSGTRIYFAPESFSGVIGKEVDYWAMGMILLEILIGDNVFRGINEGMVAHEIFTKGVEVPEHLNEGLQLLIKGLLTREPKKRWGEEQIFKWLDGERNIPVGYSYVDAHSSNVTAYTFKSKKFYDLNALLVEMYTEENYDDGKEHIMRGYVTKWLESNHDFDQSVSIEKLKINSDSDIAIYDIFNYFLKPDKLLFLSKVINLHNLTIFVGHCIADEASKREKRICKLLLNGTLYEIAKKFFSNKSSDDVLIEMLQLASKSKDLKEVFFLLKKNDIIFDALNHEIYVLPSSIQEDMDKKNIVIDENKNQIVIKTKDNMVFFIYDKLLLKSKTMLMTHKEIEFFMKNQDKLFKKPVSETEIVKNVDLYIEVSRLAKSITAENVHDYAKTYMQMDVIKSWFLKPKFIVGFPKRLAVMVFATESKHYTEQELETIRKQLKAYRIMSWRKIVIVEVILVVLIILSPKFLQQIIVLMMFVVMTVPYLFWNKRILNGQQIQLDDDIDWVFLDQNEVYRVPSY